MEAGFAWISAYRLDSLSGSVCKRVVKFVKHDPTLLKLFTALKKWAENRGAFEIYAGVSSGVELGKMDRFLRKLGFQLTGGNYSLLLGAPQS